MGMTIDCISRADVLKLMKDNWHTHNGDWAMQESMDDIRALPSVTPQPRWIPVSERLPENKTYTLVTIGVPGRQLHARSGWYQNGYFHNDNGDVWKATDIEVKAWMPLPKPFVPQKSEDKE